jgi:hypothetical protein
MNGVEPRRSRGDNVNFVVIAYVEDVFRREAQVFANEEEGARIGFRYAKSLGSKHRPDSVGNFKSCELGSLLRFRPIRQHRQHETPFGKHG